MFNPKNTNQNMASTTETGHAKTVAAFEDLISSCTGYGEDYNPSKFAITLSALNAQLTAADDALQAVKDAKTNYDNATNARELAFKPLRKLSTKVVNALAASDATKQTLADAKSSNAKIQGSRPKPIKVTAAKGEEPAKETAKTVSRSQQSFDKMIDHLSQLIATVKAEKSYQPNEAELSVAGLKALLADLKTKNSAAINTTTDLNNARIKRNKLLYATDKGLVDTAMSVKAYVKSVYMSSSPQFKQVSKLKFAKVMKLN